MRMMKPVVFLFVTTLVALAMFGCNSNGDSKPYISRLTVNPACGPAPLMVSMRADASGGQRLSDPTGGNSFLKVSWDFGDGQVVSDGASVAYHTYAAPDTYYVRVTVEDDNGETASRIDSVFVLADLLEITPYMLVENTPATTAHACQPITFAIRASTCDFDPVNGFYDRFLYHWTMNDPANTVLTGARPVFAFPPAVVGDQVVHLSLEDPGLSITRELDIPLTVLPSQGTSLNTTSDWHMEGVQNDTFQISAGEIPFTATYSVTVACTGPDDGFGVKVRGFFPAYNRISFDSSETTQGALTFDNDNRRWFWSVGTVPAGSTATADVTFYIDLGYQGSTYRFGSRMLTYPCESNAADDSTMATIVLTAK